MNFQLLFGNACGRRCWQKREPICCVMPRAVARSNCGRQSPPICATSAFFSSSRGEIELRKAIAAYLCDFRRVNCHADQIVVVGGMQQAMLVCALALINEGEVAWIEDSGFPQARHVCSFVGA